MCAAADVIPHCCLATANLAHTAYFSSSKWRATTLRTLQNWCKHWKLPSQVSARLPRWVAISNGNCINKLCRDQVMQHGTPKQWLRPSDPFVLSCYDQRIIFPTLCLLHAQSTITSCYAKRSAIQQCSSLARMVQPGWFSICVRTLRANTRVCRVYDWAFQWNKRTAECQGLAEGIQTIQ